MFFPTSFLHVSDDKVSKFSFYNGFVGQPLFVSPSAREPPSDKKDTSPSKTSTASLPSESGSPSLPCDRLSEHTHSPHRSPSSSDLESGSESEKPKDCPSPSLNPDRDPTDIMAKIFPHQRRDTLESMVRTCRGNIVKSIELVAKENKMDPGGVSPSSLLRPSLALPGALGALGAKSAFSPLHGPPAPGGDSLFGLSPQLGVSPLRLAPGSGGFMPPYMTSGLMPLLTLRPPLESFPGMIRDFSYIQGKEALCNTAGLYTRLNSDK